MSEVSDQTTERSVIVKNIFSSDTFEDYYYTIKPYLFYKASVIYLSLIADVKDEELSEQFTNPIKKHLMEQTLTKIKVLLDVIGFKLMPKVHARLVNRVKTDLSERIKNVATCLKTTEPKKCLKQFIHSDAMRWSDIKAKFFDVQQPHDTPVHKLLSKKKTYRVRTKSKHK